MSIYAIKMNVVFQQSLYNTIEMAICQESF